MPTLRLRWITLICDSMNMAAGPALTRSRKSRQIYRLAWLQSENISGTRWSLSSMTDAHQKENKSLWVGPTLISLRSEGTYEQIRQRLLDKTARDYRAGRISYDCYLQAASRPPRRHARRMVRSSSESQGTDGHRRGVSERGGNGNLVSAEEPVGEKREYLTVPYAEREEAKAAGAKWDWREKLWYVGPEGSRAGLAKWLPEIAAAAAP